jgi:hypothetical protein
MEYNGTHDVAESPRRALYITLKDIPQGKLNMQLQVDSSITVYRRFVPCLVDYTVSYAR